MNEWKIYAAGTWDVSKSVQKCNVQSAVQVQVYSQSMTMREYLTRGGGRARCR